MSVICEHLDFLKYTLYCTIIAFYLGKIMGFNEGANTVRIRSGSNNWTRTYESSFWTKFYWPIKKIYLISWAMRGSISFSTLCTRGWTGTFASSGALTDIFLVLWIGIDLMPMRIRIQLSIWCRSRSGSYLKLYTCWTLIHSSAS